MTSESHDHDHDGVLQRVGDLWAKLTAPQANVVLELVEGVAARTIREEMAPAAHEELLKQAQIHPDQQDARDAEVSSASHVALYLRLLKLWDFVRFEDGEAIRRNVEALAARNIRRAFVPSDAAAECAEFGLV